MIKFLLFLFISLSLPMISPAQETIITAEEANKRGDRYRQEKDFSNAVYWYQVAADKGHASAQTSLGAMYTWGYGVTQDRKEALKWFHKAAAQGNAAAINNIGTFYRNGWEVPKDDKEAIKWLLKAAKLGNANAQSQVGHMYYEGRGVETNYKEAAQWCEKAADQGNVKAQDLLAYMYRNGIGVNRDDKTAVLWWQKAADQGYAQAQYQLATMYLSGLGVTQSSNKAVEWLKKAADQDDDGSMELLGDMYFKGNGVTKDYSQALKWYQKAANLENVHAYYNLGVMYENGYGINQDYEEALKWYQKAADIGYVGVKEDIANLQKKIEKEEPQPKVETFLVDNDIPVTNSVNKNTFAIIIANENYLEEAKVEFAKNDGEVFKNYCRKTLGVPEKNIKYLPDATLAKMIGELDWLQQVCEAYKGEANVIFYYTGHGFPDEQSHSAYLLPVDGRSRLLRTCFNLAELYEMLGSMPSKRVTVLMDACFSGAKRNGEMLASAKGVAIKAKSGVPKGNMVVLSAAQGNETAYFHHEGQHGLFTYFLLKKLKETKGRVTLGELSNYLKDEVSKFSIVENGKSQTPTVQVSDELSGSWQSLSFN